MAVAPHCFAPDDGIDDDPVLLERAESARPKASAALAQRKLKRMLYFFRSWF